MALEALKGAQSVSDLVGKFGMQTGYSPLLMRYPQIAKFSELKARSGLRYLGNDAVPSP